MYIDKQLCIHISACVRIFFHMYLCMHAHAHVLIRSLHKFLVLSPKIQE